MEKTYNLDHIDQIAQFLLEQTNSKNLLFDAPMGAGKTTLVKSICKQLGVKDEITSPTFSIVNEYKGSSSDIFHFDLYRIENTTQLMDIGFEDYLYKNAFCLIEWPEFSIPFLDHFHKISIEIIDLNSRRIKW